ncbi:hypothetical protein [Ruegeria sp. 6PALISEP08]|uniref:hypothetical protein n=1 Tax=Ruegeria sp. 6PALISEP08 TaxID=1225660 RepID=UPI00067EDB11|nr:hypothetical protein [Ruegeria sp. 6PALISEP08]
MKDVDAAAHHITLKSIFGQTIRSNPSLRLENNDASSSQSSRRTNGGNGRIVWKAIDIEGHKAHLVDGDVARTLRILELPRTFCLGDPLLSVCPPRRQLYAMVLDGLLQIQDANNTFQTGVKAINCLVARNNLARVVLNQRLQKISRQAIIHAFRCRNLGAARIFDELYRYNSSPAGNTLKECAAKNDMTDWLLQHSNGVDLKVLKKLDLKDRWVRWLPISEGYKCRIAEKIYVSPQIEFVPEVIRQVVKTADQIMVPALKVGRTFADLNRPDKIVVYTSDHKQTETFIGEIEQKFQKVTPQGVPFSVSAKKDGLISWSSEIEQSDSAIRSGQRSWRSYICTIIANLIGELGQTNTDLATGLDHVLARLYIGRCCPLTWAPLND